MMWFRSPCVNECCASWEKVCLIYELNFCRKNASFEREKLYSVWLDFLFVVFSYDVRGGCEKKLICYDYIRSYKNIFQKNISRYFFSFFQTVFYCRRCKLFILLRTDYGSWHWLYPGIVGIVKERNVSGRIKRRRSTWLVLHCVLVIVPERHLELFVGGSCAQHGKGKNGERCFAFHIEPSDTCTFAFLIFPQQFPTTTDRII